MRAGGHAAPGFGTSDGGIVIDLTPLKAIHVDPARRIAWVQPGVLWGELDAATQEHGLAVTGGRGRRRASAGFTLGSRQWLARAQDGPRRRQPARGARAHRRRARSSTRPRTENADLFWALRGGGGNFGDRRRVRVRPAAGRPDRPRRHAAVAARPRRARSCSAYRDLMIEAPDSLCGGIVLMSAPPLPMVPTELQGQARGRRDGAVRGRARPRCRAPRAAARARAPPSTPSSRCPTRPCRR